MIENEIGEVSIDDALVEQKHVEMAEELVLLDNGCICCTVRGDLIQSLQRLLGLSVGDLLISDKVLDNGVSQHKVGSLHT